MKRLTLVVILLFIGVFLVQAGSFTDIMRKFKNTAVDVSTYTVTEICPANGNRNYIELRHSSDYTVLVVSGSYTVAYSTTNGFPVIKSLPLIFEDYVGPIYGITTGTTTPINVRVIELEP